MMRKVCSLEDFDKGRVVKLVDGKEIVLVKIENQIFAFDNECTHEKYPLYDGVIDGKEIECVHHGARFSLEDGKVLALPATTPLKIYKTFVKGNDDFVVN